MSWWMLLALPPMMLAGAWIMARLRPEIPLLALAQLTAIGYDPVEVTALFKKLRLL